MILNLVGEYKSLNTFESEPLGNFTVIVGRNGSGKSQLVELFLSKQNNTTFPATTFSLIPACGKIQVEGISNHNLSTLRHENWKAKIDVIINDFNQLKINSRKLAKIFLDAGIWISNFNNTNILSAINESIISSSDLEELIADSLREFEPSFFSNLELPFAAIANRLTTAYFFELRYHSCVVAGFVSKFRNKEFHDLIDADFYNTPIPEHFLEAPKLFGSQLEYLFYNYAKRRDQNGRRYFEKKEEGIQNDSIPDEEFVSVIKPPWDWINEIFSDHGIGFQIKGINKSDFSPDASISFQLTKTSINKEIEFQNLSSGEKVIIGLIIKLFTSQYYQDNLELPEIIVLDEPDAHLHPEMSKLLVDVLNITFVQKLGIKVIMVTHSPSTVALSPDSSIYELQNEPITSLKQIEKDEALEILTGNLPTLSIDYKNHKQVFVESPTDVKYYQTIFNKLNQERHYPFRLYFISNSLGKGNCTQVEKVVEAIRLSGNRTSFGIIDWDLKNKNSGYVKVHGFEKRYSIENYIYDPIYISVLLMTLKANNIFTELGIDETYNQYSIGLESLEFLQKISDWFFLKYYSLFSVNEESKQELIAVEYLNSKKVKIPMWYLEFKGHDLEQRIKQMFNSLEGKYRNEGKLQKELTIIIGKCYPFVPKDSEILIEEIINVG